MCQKPGVCERWVRGTPLLATEGEPPLALAAVTVGKGLPPASLVCHRRS